MYFFELITISSRFCNKSIEMLQGREKLLWLTIQWSDEDAGQSQEGKHGVYFSLTISK